MSGAAILMGLAAGAEAMSPPPPRGFNTWNSFTQWASERDLMNQPLGPSQASFLASTGMRELNFTYVVADGGWYYDSGANGSSIPGCDGGGNSWTCAHIDANGRLLPDPARYPDGWK
eukprot:gene7649-7129_t